MAAGYDGLTAAEQERFEGLMAMPIGQWPQGLRDFANQEKPGCGDEIADVVGRWVKMARFSG